MKGVMMEFVTEKLVKKFLEEHDGELSKKINPIVLIITEIEPNRNYVFAKIFRKSGYAVSYVFNDHTVDDEDDTPLTNDFQKFMIRECGEKYTKYLVKKENEKHKKALNRIQQMYNANSIEL